MISRTALTRARGWCDSEHSKFAKVGRKCLAYLRLRQSVLGPFETQADKDDAFLTLFQFELDHLHDEELDRRTHALWASV